MPIYSFLIARLRSRQKQIIGKYMKKRKLILYGAGKIGKKLLSSMRDLGLNVKAFWDSNVSLQGNILEDVPIQAPYQKNQWQDSAIILLATIKDNDAIATSLQSLGYERVKDFFMMDRWVGWVAKVWLGRL